MIDAEDGDQTASTRKSACAARRSKSKRGLSSVYKTSVAKPVVSVSSGKHLVRWTPYCAAENPAPSPRPKLVSYLHGTSTSAARASTDRAASKPPPRSKSDKRPTWGAGGERRPCESYLASWERPAPPHAVRAARAGAVAGSRARRLRNAALTLGLSVASLAETAATVDAPASPELDARVDEPAPENSVRGATPLAAPPASGAPRRLLNLGSAAEGKRLLLDMLSVGQQFGLACSGHDDDASVSATSALPPVTSESSLVSLAESHKPRRRCVIAAGCHGATFAVRVPLSSRARAPATARENVALRPIRKRMHAAAYTFGGADWEKFFRQYDKTGDGALDLAEFQSAVRRVLKLPPDQLSDAEIKLVFRRIDNDGSGEIHLPEMLEFINAPAGEPEGTAERKAAAKKAERERLAHRASARVDAERAWLDEHVPRERERLEREQLELAHRSEKDEQRRAAASRARVEQRAQLERAHRAERDEQRRAAASWTREQRGQLERADPELACPGGAPAPPETHRTPWRPVR